MNIQCFFIAEIEMKLAKISIGRVTKVDIIEGSPLIGRLDINSAGISFFHNPVCCGVREMNRVNSFLSCQMGPIWIAEIEIPITIKPNIAAPTFRALRFTLKYE